MKLEEIKLLYQKKLSALDILVYNALRKLRKKNKVCPKNSEVSEFLPGCSHQSISRTKARLYEKKIIGIVEHGIGSKVFFLDSEKEEFYKEIPQIKRSRAKRITGIYSIEFHDKIYIGQSLDIKKRWNGHDSLIKRKIHPYVKGNPKYKFKILEECRMDQLNSRELLWVQRLYDRGHKICNENNFSLIREEI